MVLLIRHALTDATGKRLSGQAPGIHLSDQGREQAKRLAERLAPIPLAAIYSSPLERFLGRFDIKGFGTLKKDIVPVPPAVLALIP